MAWEKLNEIPGVSCVKPKGALYAFPRIDPAVHKIHDDEKFVLDLLLREKIQVVQGTGFNWPRPDHFRILTLPLRRRPGRGDQPDRTVPERVPAVEPARARAAAWISRQRG